MWAAPSGHACTTAWAAAPAFSASMRTPLSITRSAICGKRITASRMVAREAVRVPVSSSAPLRPGVDSPSATRISLRRRTRVLRWSEAQRSSSVRFSSAWVRSFLRSWARSPKPESISPKGSSESPDLRTLPLESVHSSSRRVSTRVISRPETSMASITESTMRISATLALQRGHRSPGRYTARLGKSSMSEVHVSGEMAPRQGTSTTEGLSLAMPVSMQVR